jgi:hypothetical protein
MEALEAGETVMVDGYGIGARLYHELVALHWPGLLDALECPGLFIVAEETSGKAPRPLRALGEKNAHLQFASASEPAFWRESKHLYRAAPNMTKASLEWLERQAS